MIQFMVSHGVTPQLLYGIAIGMMLGALTRLLEYFIT